jgi:predicted dinucleotide-binding enzyme
MSIGILGTGRMGVRLAEAFARAGAQVTLGSRDPRRAERIVAGRKQPGMAPGTYDAAV